MSDINTSLNGEETRRRWRQVTRRCLIASFHSHKGGQGRTLTCAHTALMLAKGQLEKSGRSGAPKILMVDLDWEAPGLSYMFKSDALPPSYKVENEETHREEGGWHSIELISKLYDVVLQNVDLQRAILQNEGIPHLDADYQVLTTLETEIFGTRNVDPNKVALRISTPPLITDLGSTSASIYLLPANPITSAEAAFRAMSFDANFLTGVTEADHQIWGASLLRLFTLLLIRIFRVDFVLIDCRAGITPLGYMVSSRLADIVVIPTTTYNQALDGARVFKEILCKPTRVQNEKSPYSPEIVIVGLSNVQEGLWVDHGKQLQLIKTEKENVLGKLGLSQSSEPSFVLPRLTRLGRRERYVTKADQSDEVRSEQERINESFYEREIERISGWIVDAWAEKARGFLGHGKSSDVFSPGLLYRVLAVSDATRVVRILVESGGFGVDPFVKLLESTVAQQLKGRFSIKPVGIDHALLKQIISENKVHHDFRRIPEEYPELSDLKEDFSNLDLVAFPHYMLGKLVKSDWILPLTVLGGDQEFAPPIDLTYLRNNFYLAEELCTLAGTLYAFPFSLIRKLLLVRKGFTRHVASEYQAEFKEPLDLNLAGWREIERALVIARNKSRSGDGVIIVEDKLTHIGIWYDWLEFVYAYGGADFFREGTARGSDYGVCGLNNPATIDGTLAYLSLYWKELIARSTSTEEGTDWYHTLDRLKTSTNAWMAIAWSDILTSEESSQLLSKFHCSPFPSASPSKETIIEGWVIGLPSALPPDRYQLIDASLRWFLSKEVQEKFVAVGGDSSRKFQLEDLETISPILKIVHSAFLPGTGTGELEPHVAPKIKFPEALEVIEEIRETLETMINWPRHKQNQASVAQSMDDLARHVATVSLMRKSRYVPRKS